MLKSLFKIRLNEDLPEPDNTPVCSCKKKKPEQAFKEGWNCCPICSRPWRPPPLDPHQIIGWIQGKNPLIQVLLNQVNGGPYEITQRDALSEDPLEPHWALFHDLWGAGVRIDKSPSGYSVKLASYWQRWFLTCSWEPPNEIPLSLDSLKKDLDFMEGYVVNTLQANPLGKGLFTLY